MTDVNNDTMLDAFLHRCGVQQLSLRGLFTWYRNELILVRDQAFITCLHETKQEVIPAS